MVMSGNISVIIIATFYLRHNSANKKIQIVHFYSHFLSHFGKFTKTNNILQIFVLNSCSYEISNLNNVWG